MRNLKRSPEATLLSQEFTEEELAELSDGELRLLVALEYEESPVVPNDVAVARRDQYRNRLLQRIRAGGPIRRTHNKPQEETHDPNSISNGNLEAAETSNPPIQPESRLRKWARAAKRTAHITMV